MMVAVLLGALTLGACVDDNESASVTKVREAKAAQLNALAAKASAEAEAELIYANAEKALKEAQAAWYNEQTEEAKATFAAKIEQIKAEAEAAIAAAKLKAAKKEQELLDLVDGRIQTLYGVYLSELENLNDMTKSKVSYEYSLAQYKAQLVSVEEYVTKQAAIYQSSIDQKTIELDAWKNYSGIDQADLEEKAEKLAQEKYTAYAAWQAKVDVATPLKKSAEVATEVFDVDYEGKSTVAAVAALQDFSELESFYTSSYGWLSESEARAAVEPSYQKGLCSWYSSHEEPVYDGSGNQTGVETVYVLENVKPIYLNSTQYFVEKPIVEGTVYLDDAESFGVPTYSLKKTAITAALTQYYTNGKAGAVQYLGSEASGDKLATGLYLDKENKTAALSEAQKAYTKAQEDFATAEKTYKKTSDAKDAAETAQTSAKKAYDDAVKAENTAKEALDKANAGTDEAAKTAAKTAYEAAQKATATAQKTYDDAVTVYNKAVTACNNAQSAYSTLEYTTLPKARKAANEAELDLAYINDRIASYTEDVEQWDAKEAAWTAVSNALSGNGLKTYEAAIEALKTNKDVAAYFAAMDAAEEAEDAYDLIVKELRVANTLLNKEDVKNAAEEIRTLEKDIAGLNTKIAKLKEYFVLDDGQYNSTNYYEKMVANTQAEIDNLTAEIKVQQEIVDLAYTRVEAAIKAETAAE